MAKNKPEQNMLQLLKEDIRSKNFRRLYVFHGEETYLLNHYLERMKKNLVDELTESFNFHKFNNENFELQNFVDSVEGFPMMAESTLVLVDEVDLFKLPEGDRTKLTEVLSDIPDWCSVIFTYETVSWKPDKRQKKLWESISAHGLIVEFEKQNQRDLIAWVSKHFLNHGKRISNDLCAYLIDITGGTMTVLAGEIRKIISYSGADEIKKSEIELFLKLKNNEYSEIRKDVILNLPELLRAIYLFTLFEA